jgi:hypothetical protein
VDIGYDAASCTSPTLATRRADSRSAGECTVPVAIVMPDPRLDAAVLFLSAQRCHVQEVARVEKHVQPPLGCAMLMRVCAHR